MLAQIWGLIEGTFLAQENHALGCVYLITWLILGHLLHTGGPKLDLERGAMFMFQIYLFVCPGLNPRNKERMTENLAVFKAGSPKHWLTEREHFDMHISTLRLFHLEILIYPLYIPNIHWFA